MVQVVDASGDVVATQAVANDQTFMISLPPGTYTAQASSGTSSAPGDTAPYVCESNGSFTVSDGHQTVVEIACNLP